MLSVLKAIHDKSPGLSDETGAHMRDIFEKVETQLITPFFEEFDAKSLDEVWDEWTEWFQPYLGNLIDRVMSTFLKERVLRSLASSVDKGFPELVAWAGTAKPRLGEAFKGAVKVGVKADMTLLHNIDRLQVSEHMPEQVVHMRMRGSMMFGLAVLLTAAHRDREVAEPERISFLVEKVKKLSSVSLMNSLRLLKWADEGGVSETMER
jgi:hypothetical protein